MKQTAVEWLAEKLEYVNWMRNRDEISAGMADEWRKHYLEQAKAMDEKNLKDSFVAGAEIGEMFNNENRCFVSDAEQYLKETYKSK